MTDKSLSPEAITALLAMLYLSEFTGRNTQLAAELVESGYAVLAAGRLVITDAGRSRAEAESRRRSPAGSTD